MMGVEMSLTKNYETYLKLDLSGYIGQWVAIFNNKVISHGTDPKEVYKEAMKISNNQIIMLTKIPSRDAIEIYFSAD
jgi:DNA repair protein RadC